MILGDMVLPEESAPPEGFRPELRSFADRIRWVRTFELRVSVKELARRLEYPTATVAAWEDGVRPRDKTEVAQRYHDVAPHVPVHWLLIGPESPNSHIFWQPGVVVDDGQLRLDFVLPPSRSGPELAVA